LKAKSPGDPDDVAVDSRVLKILLPHVPLKTAVALSAEITGQAKKPLYALALTLKSEAS
jgi:16S rRNA (cytidine1402-2'-O)-methyltransferase